MSDNIFKWEVTLFGREEPIVIESYGMGEDTRTGSLRFTNRAGQLLFLVNRLRWSEVILVPDEESDA
jgi:hypothetical protein